MERSTKIIATIGPACESREMLEKLIDAGVDVLRFNMKHNTIEWHSERMELVETICRDTGRSVGMLLDLQGPEVRIDRVPDRWRKIKPGDEITFTCADKDGVVLDHPEIFPGVFSDHYLAALIKGMVRTE